MNENNYIASLVKPITNKSSSRKAWSIDLETVWLPFFTATNAMGGTSIPHDALGCPLRLGYNADGSVKFLKSGKPLIQVTKEVAASVRMVRENFVAGLQSYAHEVYTTQADAYKAEVALNIEAGKPIAKRDNAKLTEAIANLAAQVKAQADKEAQAQADKAKVAEAMLHADNTPDKSKVKVRA